MSDDKIVDLKSTNIDEEIADYVDEKSEQFKTLSELKKLEDGWQVSHFVSGAKLAYEEILMAFENGDLDKIKKLPEHYHLLSIWKQGNLQRGKPQFK